MKQCGGGRNKPLASFRPAWGVRERAAVGWGEALSAHTRGTRGRPRTLHGPLHPNPQTLMNPEPTRMVPSTSTSAMSIGA